MACDAAAVAAMLAEVRLLLRCLLPAASACTRASGSRLAVVLGFKGSQWQHTCCLAAWCKRLLLHHRPCHLALPRKRRRKAPLAWARRPLQLYAGAYLTKKTDVSLTALLAPPSRTPCPPCCRRAWTPRLLLP